MKVQISSYFKNVGALLCSILLLLSCSKDDEPGNRPPQSFKLIEVADGAIDTELQPRLKWEAAADLDGDKVTYQVYLDTDNPPQTSIVSNLDVNTLTVEDALQPEATYYWKVIAEDSQGNATESNVASFTTREKTTKENLIGKWFYESIEGQPPLSDCRKKSFLHFTPESVRLEIRSQDDDGICQINSSVEHTYEVIGNEILLGIGVSMIIETITDSEMSLLEGDRYTLRKE